jgi:hypothetical protein
LTAIANYVDVNLTLKEGSMLRRKLASLMIAFFLFSCLCGCGTTPIQPPTPTTVAQIEQYSTIAGGLIAGLVPTLAGPTGAAIVAQIKIICALKGSNGDPSALMTLLENEFQKVWTLVDATGATGIAITVALNAAWGFLQASVTGQDATVVLTYANALITGLCAGMGVSTAQTSVSGQLKLWWYKSILHAQPTVNCCP